MARESYLFTMHRVQEYHCSLYAKSHTQTLESTEIAQNLLLGSPNDLSSFQRYIFAFFPSGSFALTRAHCADPTRLRAIEHPFLSQLYEQA